MSYKNGFQFHFVCLYLSFFPVTTFEFFVPMLLASTSSTIMVGGLFGSQWNWHSGNQTKSCLIMQPLIVGGPLYFGYISSCEFEMLVFKFLFAKVIPLHHFRDFSYIDLSFFVLSPQGA